MMEWGVLFPIYKRLKMDCNVGWGASGKNDIPFKELPNLTNNGFIPGMGLGYGIYGAINIGLFVEL